MDLSARRPAAARPACRMFVYPVVLLALATAGCPELQRIVTTYQASTQGAAPQVAIVIPTAESTVNIGTIGPVQWADIAPEDGTLVTVEALRFDANDALLETTTLLVGRDAQADGPSDSFSVDTSSLTAGRYRFRITLTAPSGLTASTTTKVVITLQ